MQNEVDTHTIEHLDFEHVLMCELRGCDTVHGETQPARWLVTGTCHGQGLMCEPCRLIKMADDYVAKCPDCAKRYTPGRYAYKSFVSVGQ